MRAKKECGSGRILLFAAVVCAFVGASCPADADLNAIRERGVLRHLGIVSANFVREDGTGLDVALMRRFADSLGVRYELIRVSAAEARSALSKGEGDVASGGLLPGTLSGPFVTSQAFFPLQMWLLAPRSAKVEGLAPIGRISVEIARAKKLLKGRSAVAPAGSVVDATVRALKREGFKIRSVAANPETLLAAAAKGDFLVVDSPTALVLLERGGAVNYVGPFSEERGVVLVFRKEDGDLRAAFDDFFGGEWGSWEFAESVREYYPVTFNYFTPFFRKGHSDEPPTWLKPDPAYYVK